MGTSNVEMEMTKEFRGTFQADDNGILHYNIPISNEISNEISTNGQTFSSNSLLFHFHLSLFWGKARTKMSSKTFLQKFNISYVGFFNKFAQNRF